jgi:hypothetical protein
MIALAPAAIAWTIVVVARSTSITTTVPPAKCCGSTKAGAGWMFTIPGISGPPFLSGFDVQFI